MNRTEMISMKVSERWEQPQVIVVDNATVSLAEIEGFRNLLSSPERVKSERFRFARDRVSYTIVHGLLRRILGDYYDLPGQEVEIRYDDLGKPFVHSANRKMFFNLSHSGGLSILAFDRYHEIGVDVEQIRKEFDFRPVVDRFFAGAEKELIFSPEVSGITEFYRIWTRKEALLKAIGIGIGEHLGIDVKGPVSSGFLLHTTMWGEEYFISVATNPASGPVKHYMN